MKYTGLLNCTAVPMNDAESKLLTNLILLEKQNADVGDTFDNTELYPIIKGRLSVFDKNGELKIIQPKTKKEQKADEANVPDISPYVIMLCAGIAKKPAVAVMWAFTLLLLYKKNKNKSLKISHWVDNYPFGIPSDGQLKSQWESQKRSDHKSDLNSDNNLDCLDFWVENAK